jgi:propionyl-CoA carboxylase alpha chain
MFKRILIANRGEIACRIIRTARRMGIETVAVYSEADKEALHVEMADAAVAIGPAPATQSYLSIEAMLAACRQTKAEAVHPGYGFLSEREAFPLALQQAGIVFIGPNPAAIAAMGDKIESKKMAARAEVSTVPGHLGAVADEAEALRVAEEIGYPVMIKASAGGGGKGIRIVYASSEIAEGLARARSEAKSSFGDDRMFIEKFIPEPRHVEIQVLGDKHGNVIHLGERECSIQRRNQKVVEEAPSPLLDEATRARMGAQAVALAKAVGYDSAGTVEFVTDQQRNFYFLEMNTRLQVEHPVTEAVTGLDLVEWQLRVAAGESLPLAQEAIAFSGHAIEARLVAEDPARGFLPSAGRLELLEWPRGEGVRVDAGFGSGDAVPEHYDSLLGKVIASAPTRDEAAARLARALEETFSAGLHTNEQYLARILRAPRFLEVRHHIALLDSAGGEFAAPAAPPADALILAALFVHAAAQGTPGESPWALADGFTPNLPARIAYAFAAPGRTHQVGLDFTGGAPGAAAVDGEAPRTLRAVRAGERGIGAQIGERRAKARCHLEGARVYLWLDGARYELTLEDPRTREFSASAATGGLTTPLPGAVVAVAVRVGDAVQAGDVLMVIEAMKMEHTITAPYAGSVTAIHFAPGERVPEGSELLALKRAEA